VGGTGDEQRRHARDERGGDQPDPPPSRDPLSFSHVMSFRMGIGCVGRGSKRRLGPVSNDGNAGARGAFEDGWCRVGRKGADQVRREAAGPVGKAHRPGDAKPDAKPRTPSRGRQAVDAPQGRRHAPVALRMTIF
jgi:hypothetical protein